MSALSDYLRVINKQVTRTPVFDGVLTEGSGQPTASTPPNYMFYYDSTGDVVYINATRDETMIHPTGSAWVGLIGADAVAGQTLLTATS